MSKDSSVLVTGGASLVGSHLVDSLLKNDALVRVADDFSGKLENSLGLRLPTLSLGTGRIILPPQRGRR